MPHGESRYKLNRVFYAFPLYELFKQELDSLASRLRSEKRVRWIPIEHAHLTLHFFSALTDEQVLALKRATENGLRSSKGILMQLKGLGCFPSEDEPKVVWLGVTSEAGLFRIQGELTAIYRHIGLPVDIREYQPHVTLGRPKRGCLLDPHIEGYLSEFQTGKKELTKIFLYKSHLTPQGTRYEILQEIQLASL